MIKIVKNDDGGRYIPKGHSSTVISRGIFKDALDIHQTTFPPNSSMEEEVHPESTHVFYILEGSMQVLQGGESIGILEVGDSVIIPAGDFHEVVNAGEEDLSFLAITF